MLETNSTNGSPVNIREKAAADMQTIYDAIMTSLSTGTLAVGAKLPTERRLSTTYGAARNTVRKAMNALVDEGVVVRHVGRGTFVANAPCNQPAPKENVASLAEILEARLLFEPDIAHLVVERAEDKDFAEMYRCLDGIRSAADWRQYKEWKYALHLAITRATRNLFLVQIFDAVIEARRQDGWGHRGHAAPVPVAVREASLRANTEIVEALQARDADRARAVMHDYLSGTLASVQGF
jgi:GntR family transcriptional regulator, transcriptional repressor for pyruvate dehydrogenase complex